jgi:hypothetical protein
LSWTVPQQRQREACSGSSWRELTQDLNNTVELLSSGTDFNRL